MKAGMPLLMVLLLSPVASAAATVPTTIRAKPREATTLASCTKAECHADKKAFPIVHGPVAVNACDACHELKDAKEHTFKLVREKAEMCTYCHDFDVSMMPVIHKPVATGECLGCHDPHGGKTQALVRENTMPQLCGRCHESVTFEKSSIHTPVAKGECDACHSPHASRLPRLLDAAGADLCLACHKNLEARMAKSRYVHKAIDKGCEKCHDVHASNYPDQLVASIPDLCTSCHEKVKVTLATATVKHSVTTEGRACLTCHAPHDSNFAKLMVDTPLKICMSCHAEKIKGTEIAAVPEILDPKLTRHRPIRDGQCSGCHAAHGGTRKSLLTYAYSTAFYKLYDPDQYELCFSCHDVRLTLSKETTSDTAFRNGTKNLHYLHLHEGERGRGCSVCHAVHAAPNDRNVKATFLFGHRELPIDFQRTPTGGRCAPGCHLPYSYDRVQAIPIPTQPATRPAPAVVRAELLKPGPVRFGAVDTDGEAIAVPSLEYPTVIVLVRAGQAENAQLPALILAGIASRPVQLIYVVSGKEAAREALTLNGTVILDPEHSLSSKLGVWGWPVILVVDTKAQAIARIGGAPESLPVRLGPYLDFAAGKIDQTAFAARIAMDDVAKLDAQRKVERMVATIDSLLQQGKVQEAERISGEALKLAPTSAAVMLARVKTLAATGQGYYAIEILNDIPDKAISHDDRDVIETKIMVSQDRWDEATALIAKILARNPRLAEAHWLRAEVYERQKNWKLAAREYRLAHELTVSRPPSTQSVDGAN